MITINIAHTVSDKQYNAAKNVVEKAFSYEPYLNGVLYQIERDEFTFIDGYGSDDANYLVLLKKIQRAIAEN